MGGGILVNYLIIPNYSPAIPNYSPCNPNYSPCHPKLFPARRAANEQENRP